LPDDWVFVDAEVDRQLLEPGEAQRADAGAATTDRGALVHQGGEGDGPAFVDVAEAV
jgi:hypothetical protein